MENFPEVDIYLFPCQQIMEFISSRYDKPRNGLYGWFTFGNTRRNGNESPREFAYLLKDLARFCEFGTTFDQREEQNIPGLPRKMTLEFKDCKMDCHFSAACLKSGNARICVDQKPVRTVNVDDNVFTFTMENFSHGISKKFMIPLLLNGVNVKMLADSGATVSYIEPPLKGCTNNTIEIKGRTNVNVKRASKDAYLPVIVTTKDDTPILGTDWMDRFKIGLKLHKINERTSETSSRAKGELWSNIRMLSNQTIKHSRISRSFCFPYGKRCQEGRVTVYMLRFSLYILLPFQISSAPATFQAVMVEILKGIPFTTCFIDDIIISGKDDDEHLKNLTEVLKRLSTHNISTKLEKCQFMKSKVSYMGHTLDAEGIHPQEDNIKSIRYQRTPTNITQLKSFLGAMSGII
ncbi:hypothetical protein RF11_14390 [Thelohanellus kitauei]|uniref:Reverse transcriptase domain-containing protein n=1 Tax=Thelohanellus kitauei TaxID=669202 RepID=A0A0C2MUW5_THEKT|nr:hypothetical protein RF11_14390 [Thelohanellus kitauei]